MIRTGKRWLWLMLAVLLSEASITPWSEAGHTPYTSGGEKEERSSLPHGESHRKLPMPKARKSDMHRQRLSGLPGVIEQEHIAVLAKRLSAEEIEQAFDENLLRRGVQPVSIEIRNEATEPARFRKADVNAHYVPAERVARYAYANPIVVGLRFVRWPIACTGAFIIRMGREVHCPKPVTNRDIREDYRFQEIPDAEIAPGGSLDGMLFLPAASSGPVTITLTKTGSPQPLMYTFPD